MFHVVLYIIYMNSTGASPVSWTKKKKHVSLFCYILQENLAFNLQVNQQSSKKSCNSFHIYMSLL